MEHDMESRSDMRLATSSIYRIMRSPADSLPITNVTF
jgi:hypothetical protein